MKRILSLMIIAMLLVGCLSTVAFAEGGERTGTISFTIGGAEFSSFGGTISVSSPATITGISGGAVGGPSGKVGFASMTNVSGVSITVSVSVPANYCGSISASFAQAEAKQMQYADDGTFTGSYNDVSLSGGGSTTFAHDWGNEVVTPGADCQTKGTKSATCNICGVADTTDGPVGAHKIKTEWDYDNAQHWHKCELCDHTQDHADHSLVYSSKAPVSENEPGWEVAQCFCGYKKSRVIPWSPVPGMGDATPYGAYNVVLFIAVVFALCCTTAVIFKRKFIK